MKTPALLRWHDIADPFSAVVAAATDWDAPSPCAGWAARDVVEHVVTTQRGFLAEHGLDADAEPAAGPAGRWSAHQGFIAQLLSDPAVAGREFAGYFGPSTVGETLVDFYGVDLLTHRWDLAVSQGMDPLLTEQDLEAIEAAMDGFGDQAYAPGLFAPPVPVGEDAGRRARVLARTGRRA